VKRMVSLTVACCVALAALSWSMTPARAQVPPQVKVTFHLTINGTAPPSDGFDVNWAENGLTLCLPHRPTPTVVEAPFCAGMGHTYEFWILFPQDSTAIQFHFTRVTVAVNGTVSQRQEFAQQTVTPLSNHTVNASFTYAGPSTISVPTTGAAPAVVLGGSRMVAGAFVIAVVLRRRPAGSIER
jgi:hypothetical protein